MEMMPGGMKNWRKTLQTSCLPQKKISQLEKGFGVPNVPTYFAKSGVSLEHGILECPPICGNCWKNATPSGGKVITESIKGRHVQKMNKIVSTYHVIWHTCPPVSPVAHTLWSGSSFDKTMLTSQHCTATENHVTWHFMKRKLVEDNFFSVDVSLVYCEKLP